jgi:hypothetical protein
MTIKNGQLTSIHPPGEKPALPPLKCLGQPNFPSWSQQSLGIIIETPPPSPVQLNLMQPPQSPRPQQLELPAWAEQAA